MRVHPMRVEAMTPAEWEARYCRAPERDGEPPGAVRPR